MPKKVTILYSKNRGLDDRFTLKKTVGAKSFDELNCLALNVLDELRIRLNAGLRLIVVDDEGERVEEIRIANCNGTLMGKE